MNFYLKISIAAVVIILVALLAIFLFSGGEEGKVKAALKEAFEAARRGDAEGVIAHVSLNFSNDGSPTYESACQSIRANVGPKKYRDLELPDLEVSVFGDSASAKCRVRVIQPADMPGVPWFNQNFELGLRKENGRWLVTSANTVPPAR